MRYILLLIVISFSMTSVGQNLKGSELLQRAINYHDADGKWNSFNNEFKVVMTTPNAPKRTSHIKINLPSQYFSVTAIRDTVTTVYTLDKGICEMIYNGKLLDSAKALEKKMTCDRANLYKNYYTYLYGLPMKLKDDGTNLSETVEKITFKGKDYLKLQVTYDDTVGSDIWYFYFNPISYALEAYQFFKTDDKGNQNPESGEYILLTEETTVNGIKMPKVRAWYYNKDNTYLGTDTLIDN